MDTWDLFERCLAAVAAFACGDLFVQVEAFAGANGVLPVNERFRAYETALPDPIQRFIYFPTLLWLSRKEAFIRALLLAASVVCLYGAAFGTHPLTFFTAWVVYSSLSDSFVLFFPWDQLLKEACLYAMLLPAHGAAPSATVALLFRVLPARLMFGFGLIKFASSTRKDMLYLKSVMLRFPIQSKIGWYLFNIVPDWLWRVSYAFYFFAEIPSPLMMLMPHFALRVVGAATVSLELRVVFRLCSVRC
jgi:hypothetical protein